MNKMNETTSMTIGLISARLKKVTEAALECMDCDPCFFNLDALISPTHIRNALVRQDFHKLQSQGIKSQAIYKLLSDKYELSPGTIKQVVIGNR